VRKREKESIDNQTNCYTSPMATNNIKKRGFGSMEKEKLRMIVGKAGKKAHALGKAHTWTREEARKAGQRGGRALKGIRNKG
jgi:uncharacterized protein